MVNSIQFLRAIAALMVLFFHAATMVNERAGYGESFTNAGAAGVDIFFVISGFVIFLASKKKGLLPSEFFAKRIIRVAPPYWLYTSITVALLLFAPSAYINLKFELIPTISSYLFLLSQISKDGVGTVLGVGWTIAYEMYFYSLFFVSMLVLPRRPFKLVALVIVAGAAMSLVVQSVPAYTLVALSTLPLEFLAGCFIAKLHLRSKHLHSIAGIIVVVIGFFGIWYSGITGMVSFDRDPWRVLYFGLPAAVIVFGFVSIDAAKLFRFPRFALLLGSASYSIYLCHQFVLAAIGKGWGIFGLRSVLPSEVLLLAGFVASILVGLISYLFFERPVTEFLNAVFKNKTKLQSIAVL